MKARKFNNIMSRVNERWAAKVLGMDLNKPNGPDLISDSCIMEVKFTLIAGNKYPLTWTVLEYQMDYAAAFNDRAAYWGLGTYDLTTPVSKIKTESPRVLESLVRERGLWIVHWDWMWQYLPSRTSGRTEISEWDNTLRYPKKHGIPDPIKTYTVNKGTVYLTEGVNPEHFSFLETGKRTQSQKPEQKKNLDKVPF